MAYGTKGYCDGSYKYKWKRIVRGKRILHYGGHTYTKYGKRLTVSKVGKTKAYKEAQKARWDRYWSERGGRDLLFKKEHFQGYEHRFNRMGAPSLPADEDIFAVFGDAEVLEASHAKKGRCFLCGMDWLDDDGKGCPFCGAI